MIKLRTLITEGKFGTIHNMKDQMKAGKFDPKNPEVHISGWGVLPLKSLEKYIAKDLTSISNEIKSGGERAAKNTEYLLYKKNGPLESKVRACSEAYEQMNSSQYKRAVTMYSRKR